MEYFFIGAEASGGITVGTKSRYIAVVKRPTDKWPAVVQQLNPLRADFCKGDDTFPAV